MLNSACKANDRGQERDAMYLSMNGMCLQSGVITANGVAKTEKVTLCMAARTIAPQVTATTCHEHLK